MAKTINQLRKGDKVYMTDGKSQIRILRVLISEKRKQYNTINKEEATIRRIEFTNGAFPISIWEDCPWIEKKHLGSKFKTSWVYGIGKYHFFTSSSEAKKFVKEKYEERFRALDEKIKSLSDEKAKLLLQRNNALQVYE